MLEENILSFMELFRANKRSHGVYDPKTKKGFTQHRSPNRALFEGHINGAMGLGLVAIQDDNTCWWGALDIDRHKETDREIDLDELASDIAEKDLPLVLCKTVRGVHLYVFGSEPLLAENLRRALGRWAKMLGHSSCEVFPKQDKLVQDSEGNMPYGNWINLPYFDAEGECPRHCIEGGKKASLAYFIELAQGRKIDNKGLLERSENEHREAPPCIQKMISNSVGEGHRNEAIYNYIVYAKQAYPETWRDKAYDFNAKHLDKPLEHSEAKKIVGSLGKRDYRYKCKDEPCRSLCNSAVCVTRKFGISSKEKGTLEIGEQAMFSRLTKFDTDPVKWELIVDNKPIILTTDTLMDFRAVRKAIAETMLKLVPPMKNDEWNVILNPIMQQCSVVDVPDDASIGGIVRFRLAEYLEKVDHRADPKDKDQREQLLHGRPILQIDPDTGQEVVMFRGPDFTAYLKSKKCEDLKGSALWMELRKMNITHFKIRIEEKSLNVWKVPRTELPGLGQRLKSKDFKSEF